MTEASDICVANLIAEVQKRLALYDTTIAEYHDRCLKKKLWEEVCKEVYSADTWTSFTQQEKTKCGKEVQKKWNSLRDCFRRELNAQKSAQKSGASAGTKKRKYVHFDSLLFLLPFSQTAANEAPTESEELYDSVRNCHSTPNSSRQSYDEEIITVLKEGNRLIRDYTAKRNENVQSDKGDDDDKAFLMSLLPTVKKFTSDEKLLLRIEIMKTIVSFKNSDKIPHGSPPMRQSPYFSRPIQPTVQTSMSSPLTYHNLHHHVKHRSASELSVIIDESPDYIPRSVTSPQHSSASYNRSPVHRNYVAFIPAEDGTRDSDLYSLGEE